MSRKTCSRCRRSLHLSHFYRDRCRSDGRAAYCKGCRREMLKGKKRKRVNRRRPKLTPEQREWIQATRQTKVCSQCEERKRVREFTPMATGRYSVAGECRECTAERVGAYKRRLKGYG